MRLVTTLRAGSAAGLVQRIGKASTVWVEVRLDACPLEPGEVRGCVTAARARGKRLIATCRAPAEGGSFRGSEASREALLRAAIQAGFDAVDVEERARFRRKLVVEAQRAGVEVILSRHDLKPAHEVHDLDAFVANVPPDAIAKYVAEVRGPEDLAALLRVAGLAREHGVRFAVMGLGDASLRLMAPLLGCELVYCAPPDEPPAAPGQLPAHAVQAVHDLLPPHPLVSPRHRLVVLLGDPVDHSLSPAMQNAAFAANRDALAYLAVRTPPRELRKAFAALRQLGAAGANLTAPLKEAAVPLVDQLARAAERAGSVNTLVMRRGKLVGHSTDGEGAVAALREAGVEPRGAVALVLGARGTGRAVVHALRDAGAEVLVSNRTASRAKALAREAGGEAVAWQRAALADALARAAILVHCTPLGRRGTASPLPAALLHEKLAVLDAVYRPGGTRLVRDALAKGCLALPGEAMLLHQGALAYGLWTSKRAPLGVMRSALLAAQEAV